MYFEFLLRRAHSRRRVERKYWSGVSLYSRTTCSNSVMVGTIGPMGSGLPQLGFPRRLAMKHAFPTKGEWNQKLLYVYDSPDTAGIHGKHSLALDSGMTVCTKCSKNLIGEITS
jgi:hypothetical protein